MENPLIREATKDFVKEHEDLLGADYFQHSIHHPGQNVSRALSVLADHHDDIVLGHVPVGKNKAQMEYLEKSYATMATAVSQWKQQLIRNKVSATNVRPAGDH